MDKVTRTIEVNDERTAGKSLEADARGVLARLAQSPDATIDNLGTGSLKLREGDDRDAMISAVRDEAAKMAQFTVVDNPESGDAEVYENPVEAIETDPRLAPLKGQYEALSRADRTHDGKIRSWQEVLSAIPNMPDFLAGMNSLEDAQVYFLNEEGQLVLGDGCAEPLEETLGWNYHKSRTEATRISYLDNEGKVVVVDDDDTEIPSEAQALSGRGLITLEEYKRVNKGQFEVDKYIWTESGKNPSVARDAYWDFAGVSSFGGRPRYGNAYRGSRRVLRVNLNFES